MPKNVMKLLKPSPSVSSNAFDLSHRHLMTANFGELLPITCLETVPGDYIQMRVSDLLRALPMVTSPFMRVKQHIDVWFCPYDYLWHNFEAFLTMKDNPVSSATKGFDFVPHTTKNILSGIILDQTKDHYTDVCGRNYQLGAKKLLDYLGYGRVAVKSGQTDTSKAVNLWRLAAYNKIWYDEYRQKYYDDGKRFITTGSYNAAELFNFDDLQCDSVSDSELNAQRLLPMIQMRYRLWKKDLLTGILPAQQFGYVSAVPFTGSVPVTVSGSASLSATTGFDSHEAVFYNPNDGLYHTFNDIGQLKSASNFDNISDVYHNFQADSGGHLTSRGFQSVGNNGLPYVTRDDLGATQIVDRHNHTISGSASITGSGSAGLSGTAFDILALRHAQAVQIWRENALRAGNRISDNMRAHYGKDAEYDDHRCSFLGSVDAPLNIGDIDAHAQTGSQHGQQLADVAGKGLSSLNQKVFKYKAKKFGVIMVMFSLLPEAEYESQGIDGMNTLLEREDYFQREFQNTGLKAVSHDNFYYTTSDFSPLGFAPAYIDYKQKIDKCFESFWSNNPFSPWASPKSDVSQILSSWDPSSPAIIPLSVLYVNPMLYDRNFGVAVSGEPEAEATSEQVICDFFFDVTASRPMSVVGLPQNI